ncbi:hypothetical protein B0J15DRAFT_499055 [Fusarium solani]|uniref:C2H2-type domain-containing protein n=1 Tax=Fusarium solani TaxID=169388 RepID=A0A9P9GZK6_FUSSL|nr:uncharacterized protein B0J15DRAFT_499055 [Fusarium solani]KAH7247971.1 hypothetical protein B0J15DRAFT_499055 [Fusarium solani]
MSDNIYFPTFAGDGLDFSGTPGPGPSYFQEKRQYSLDPTITALDAEGVAFHSQEPEVQTANQSFSCPYRKRNPWMFNVRDHHICATHSFPTIALLKRHIVSKHQSKDFTYSCNNCGIPFRADLDRQLHQESGLCFRHRTCYSDEYDNGINEDMHRRLRDRGARNGVSDWSTLWMTIFPESDHIPSPEFVPVVEAHETWCHFFQRLREHSCSMSAELMMQDARVHLQMLISQGQSFLAALGSTIRWIGCFISNVTQRSRMGRPHWLDEALRFSMNTGN